MDFQLLHLHKLMPDTIFFVTGVINLVLVSNLPLDCSRSCRRSHEESWSSLRVPVPKTLTQYARACEWLPQVSSACKHASGVGRTVDTGVQETSRERCKIRVCSWKWVIIDFVSSDSCFVDVSICLSWVFDEDRFLPTKLIRSICVFLYDHLHLLGDLETLSTFSDGILSLCKAWFSNEESVRRGIPSETETSVNATSQRRNTDLTCFVKKKTIRTKEQGLSFQTQRTSRVQWSHNKSAVKWQLRARLCVMIAYACHKWFAHASRPQGIE